MSVPNFCTSTGKMCFASPQQAEKRRKRIRRTRDERMVSYRCEKCGRWHLGHRQPFQKSPGGAA